MVGPKGLPEIGTCYLVKFSLCVFVLTGVPGSDYAAEDLQSPGFDVEGRLPMEGQTRCSKGRALGEG